MSFPAPALRRLAAAALAGLLAACASAPAPAPAEEPARNALDRMLARAAAKGEWERVQRACDSAWAAGKAADREPAAYWKAVAWCFRDQPDSAQALLEGAQGKWAPGPRKVHAQLLLKLIRESCAARAARSRPEEPDPRPAAAERAAAEGRLEALERENSFLRAENQRLETEKQKYQKLLKDLETIR